jgi:hypothetical protein
MDHTRARPHTHTHVNRPGEKDTQVTTVTSSFLGPVVLRQLIASAKDHEGEEEGKRGGEEKRWGEEGGKL